FFFFQAEDGIRDFHVTGVQTCALPIYPQATARILTTYGLAYEAPLAASDPDAAVETAMPLLAAGRAVAVKIDSPDIPHKTVVDRSEERRVGEECSNRCYCDRVMTTTEA